MLSKTFARDTMWINIRHWKFSETDRYLHLCFICFKTFSVVPKRKIPFVLFFQVTKREFRGQRTVDGLSKFCRDQLSDRIHEFHASQDLNLEVWVYENCKWKIFSYEIFIVLIDLFLLLIEFKKKCHWVLWIKRQWKL